MNHGHAALFGTYGMLSVALLLFSWRGLCARRVERRSARSFWGLNVGLFLMTVGDTVPGRAAQTWTAWLDDCGVRDASFFERGFVHLIGTLRALPDLTIIVLRCPTIFLLKTYRSSRPRGSARASRWEALGIEP